MLVRQSHKGDIFIIFTTSVPIHLLQRNEQPNYSRVAGDAYSKYRTWSQTLVFSLFYFLLCVLYFIQKFPQWLYFNSPRSISSALSTAILQNGEKFLSPADKPTRTWQQFERTPIQNVKEFRIDQNRRQSRYKVVVKLSWAIEQPWVIFVSIVGVAQCAGSYISKNWFHRDIPLN